MIGLDVIVSLCDVSHCFALHLLYLIILHCILLWGFFSLPEVSQPSPERPAQPVAPPSYDDVTAQSHDDAIAPPPSYSTALGRDNMAFQDQG